jgi:methionyl aminopeptidase
MIIKTDEDLEKLKKIGRICAITLREMQEATRPGMTTKELDELGGKILARYGATSAPMAVYDFPGYTCISINNEIAHGIPGDRIIKPGDMVNIDVSAELDGYFGDNGASFLIGGGDKMGQRLLKASKEALANAITAAVAGKPLNRIGHAIENTAHRHGLKLIRNLCGHGVGHTLHDEPEMIDNYYDPNDKRMLQKGLVIAIEPFISEQENMVLQSKRDGWTLFTPHGTRAAQFEHTIVVTEKRPIILTLAD